MCLSNQNILRKAGEWLSVYVLSTVCYSTLKLLCLGTKREVGTPQEYCTSTSVQLDEAELMGRQQRDQTA
jgi:hypothetical protein